MGLSIVFISHILFTYEALKGGGGLSIPHSFNYFEKIAHIPKRNMVNVPKIQKVLYPHIPKFDPSIPHPFKYLQRYPVFLQVFGQYPCIPKKPFQGLTCNWPTSLTSS